MERIDYERDGWDVRTLGRRLADMGHDRRALAHAATLAYVLMEARTLKANGRGILNRAPKGERGVEWACGEIDCRAGTIESQVRSTLEQMRIDPGRTSDDAMALWRALGEAVHMVTT